MGIGKSSKPIVKGFPGKIPGLPAGQIWAKPWYNSEVSNDWATEEYYLMYKALAHHEGAKQAFEEAKRQEMDAKMFAEEAQQAEASGEQAVQAEILKKQPKLAKWRAFCDELDVYLSKPNHKDRLYDQQVLKDRAMCDSIDQYLTLAARNSIQASAHALGFRIYGEPLSKWSAPDKASDAVRQGYPSGFFKLPPEQMYMPEWTWKKAPKMEYPAESKAPCMLCPSWERQVGHLRHHQSSPCARRDRRRGGSWPEPAGPRLRDSPAMRSFSAFL